MNLHLFFDVFIEDAPLGIYLRGDRHRFDLDHRLRTAAPAYRFQSKFDISRYSLASYQSIPWSGATIRIECQNPQHETIYEELAAMFPDARIELSRSATAATYAQALAEAGLADDAWVFFSPNNDHPFLGRPESLAPVMADATEASQKFPSDVVSIAYSHFTEASNFFLPSHHEWGAYGDVYPRLLYETDHCHVIRLNRLLLDSVHIYRARDLKWIFGSTKKEGRLIRTEDTEFYLSQVRGHVMVVPKQEWCRHYDGSKHLLDKTPPLFIPDGFFSSEIRIRYGYDEPVAGWVNINPLASAFSYQSPNGSDMKVLLEDIPSFWQSRIGQLDANPAFPSHLERAGLSYYQDLQNPWRHSPRIRNLFRSYRRYLRYRLRS